MVEASSPVMSEGKGSPEGEGEKPLLKEGERIYGAVIQPSRDLDGDSEAGAAIFRERTLSRRATDDINCC